MEDYDLGKKRFTETLKAKGKSDEEIEKEWTKFVGFVTIAILEERAKLLTEEERAELIMGLSPKENPKDYAELLKRTEVFFKEHPEKVTDEEGFKKTVMEKALSAYDVD